MNCIIGVYTKDQQVLFAPFSKSKVLKNLNSFLHGGLEEAKQFIKTNDKYSWCNKEKETEKFLKTKAHDYYLFSEVNKEWHYSNAEMIESTGWYPMPITYMPGEFLND